MDLRLFFIQIISFVVLAATVDSLCDSVQSTLLSSSADKRKRESDWNDANLEFVENLYHWCLDDVGCTRMFFQETKQNLTIFKILLGDYFGADEMHSDFAILKFVCNVSDADQLLRTSWIHMLKHTVSNARIPLYCDINHQLVFDQVSLTYECMCLPNRICDDIQYSQTFYVISLILFSILMVGLFFGAGYYIVTVIRLVALTIKKNSKKSSEERTKAAMRIMIKGQQ